MTKRSKTPETTQPGGDPAAEPAQTAIAKTAASADNEPAPPEPDEEPLVVGIGASAGGLEAFSQLLHALPPQPGLAIVFVQHLAPKHESALPTLLSATTRLPVTQVEDGVAIEANHVYVIPPNVQMEIKGGVLRD